MLQCLNHAIFVIAGGDVVAGESSITASNIGIKE
jgi:hypothetical protein